MNRFRFTLKLLVIATFLLAFTSIAQAQATRTWVSGVGDDVNPCSRTAPCKTWAGAISKTAIHGEIDALDPGGFGTLTITKSITIEGTHGQGFGSTLSSGVNGFVINIAPNANDPFREVILRNLSINGSGSSGAIGTRTGLDGVRFLQGSSVIVENCVIFAFSGDGIEANLTADGGQLFVRGTEITNITGAGIRTATSVGLLRLHVENSRINRAGTGIHVQRNTGAVITNSDISVNTVAGIHTEASTGGSSSQIDGCSINANPTGIQTGPGVTSVRLANNMITINTVAGVNFGGTTTIFTYGDNRIRANTANIVGGVLNATEGKQ